MTSSSFTKTVESPHYTICRLEVSRHFGDKHLHFLIEAGRALLGFYLVLEGPWVSALVPVTSQIQAMVGFSV